MNSNNLRLDWRTAPKGAIRDGVGEGLVKIGRDERVVVLSGDLAASTRVDKFEEQHPSRFFEMGVQEQNMAGVASGMASEGMIPFISSYAVFSPGRNWEQIRTIALSNLYVKIIGGHAGTATGKNGPTHQGTEDIALMRVLPKMTVLAPCDATQMAAAVEAAYKHEGPVYIRAARPKTWSLIAESEFEIGKIYKYREISPSTSSGRLVSLVACGMMVGEALAVADKLAERGVEAEVLNVSTVKPLDMETLIESAKKTGKVVTMEDHQVQGGMGSAVAEVLSEHCPVLVKRIGVPDRFGVSGEWEEVYREFGLDQENLEKTIIAMLNYRYEVK